MSLVELASTTRKGRNKLIKRRDGMSRGYIESHDQLTLAHCKLTLCGRKSETRHKYQQFIIRPVIAMSIDVSPVG